MFDYNISKTASNSEFKNACAKIEQRFPDCKKDDLLIDVDGSLIQVYRKDNNKITVFNDYEVDAVFIESEIDMNKVFKDAK